MTSNVGWIRGGSVFLAADTAVRRKTDYRRRPVSSLGQAICAEGGYTTEEDIGKLVKVGARAAATLCGSREVAITFARKLRELHLVRGLPIEEAIKIANVAANAVSGNGTYESLIAYHDGNPILIHSRSEDALRFLSNQAYPFAAAGLIRGVRFIEDMMPRQYCRVGGLSDARITSAWKRLAALGRLEAEQELVAALACFQHLGVHNYLGNEGVTGAFLGVRVDADGVHWQPDILYRTYDPEELSRGRQLSKDEIDQLESNPQRACADIEQLSPGDLEPMLVRCGVREEVLAIISVKNGASLACVHDFCTPDPRAWHQKYDKWLRYYPAMAKADYAVFLPIHEAGLILIAKRGDHDIAGRPGPGVTFVSGPIARYLQEHGREHGLRFCSPS